MNRQRQQLDEDLRAAWSLLKILARGLCLWLDCCRHRVKARFDRTQPQRRIK